jgi:beta-glucosidase
MEVSERMLREVFLPPWVAGIRKAGARGVMATYPAIDGTPTHASSKILTGILRGELNFQGLVLGEGSGISTIVYERLAATQKEAGQLALRAGLDVGISYEPGYMGPMAESLAEGKASMADIDRSVRRVLRQKFDLGLFEHPYVDADKALRVNHTTEAQDLALDAARQSIVLLKNEGILPLKKDLRRIAVIGPNADDQANQLGDYVPKKILHEVVTIREGIRRKLPNATVVYAKGCDVLGNDRSGFDEALRAAKGADAAIVVVGENGQGSKQATNGEGYDVASLDLTGPQDDLVRAIHQTGTPTVVVLVNGRPLSTRWISERIPALVEAWLPGERGGLAVADVLFGDYNPSGRLPITVPRHSGQLPVFYNYKPSKAYWVERGWGRRYADMPAAPLYPFGHGLSYTKFDYSNLRISPQSIDPTGQVSVSLDVRNSGGRPGEEVVQLYLNDLVSSVTRPVKELRAFEKIALNPGQTRTVTFTLKSEDLALLDQAMHWVVEPGEFEVMVGRSSADILLRGKFEVAPLPGKGMAQHPFLYCGEWQKRSIDNQEMHIVRDGKIVWTYTNQRRGELGDCHLLANGNILFSRQFGASEITPDKKIVWEYDGPPGVEIHTTFPIDADRVLLMQNGNPAKALIIHKPTGKIEREIVLPVRDPKGTHGQFRHIRMTKAGTLLVAHMDLAKVVEYNLEGRELWSVPAPSAWAAVRLDNGNTLISGNQNGYVREVNPKGETVWEITKNELPGFPLYTVQEVSRLSNGNTLINNWAGSLPLVEWPNVSQLIEVTPDKRVAWALRDYTVLGPASSTQLLDDPNSVR